MVEDSNEILIQPPATVSCLFSNVLKISRAGNSSYKARSFEFPSNLNNFFQKYGFLFRCCSLVSIIKYYYKNGFYNLNLV